MWNLTAAFWASLLLEEREGVKLLQNDRAILSFKWSSILLWLVREQKVRTVCETEDLRTNGLRAKSQNRNNKNNNTTTNNTWWIDFSVSRAPWARSVRKGTYSQVLSHVWKLGHDTNEGESSTPMLSSWLAHCSRWSEWQVSLLVCQTLEAAAKNRRQLGGATSLVSAVQHHLSWEGRASFPVQNSLH